MSTLRQRIVGSHRAQLQHLATSASNGLALAAHELDRVYRGLEPLVSGEGDSAEDLEDTLSALAQLRRTRPLSEVRTLLLTIAAHPTLRLRVAVDAEDTSEGHLDDDEGPTVIERIRPLAKEIDE